MKSNQTVWAVVGAVGLAISGLARGQLETQDFEGDPAAGFGGWMVNGNQEVFDGGNPGFCVGVPYGPFEGITLSNAGRACTLTGDLTRHGGGLRVGADVLVMLLDNWWGEPMDPGAFPIVLEFVDFGDPNDPKAFPVSVYTVGPGMPRQDQGWLRVEFEVPDPTSLDLPPGWGGTGAEDPVTLEPVLPSDRTYRNVLENVDEIRITTMRPGYFYSPNFWQAAFDNIAVESLLPPGCPADYNADGFVDGIDYDLFNIDFESPDPKQQMNADFNKDGFVDGIDYDQFNYHFEIGC